MAQSFKETAHLKTDLKKYAENFERIVKENPTEAFEPKKTTYVVRDGRVVEVDEEEAVKNKKHVTAGMCGEIGMSTFDEKAYKENYDRIRWETERMATAEEIKELTKE